MSDEDVIVTISDSDLSLAEQLQEARKNRGDWEKIEKGLRDQLLATMTAQGADRALTASGAPAFHLSRSARNTVDSKKLEALYPQVYEDVVKVTEVVKLDIDLS